VIVLLASGARLALRLIESPAGTPASAAEPAAPAEPAATAPPPTPPPPTPPPSPAPLLPEPTPAAPEPPPLPAEITIDVDGAPPGLVAVIDGKERALPLKLPRAPTPIEVIFRAPGFEARRAIIDRDGDQTLQVLLRGAPRPAPRGKRPRGAARPVDLPMESLSGAPIIDP